MDKTPKKDGVAISQQSALSGKIIIKVPNAKVNQFALYKKYQKEFPAVEIAYDENVIGSDNLIKAHKIEFFNTPNVTAENEAYYTVLTDGTYSLKQLVAADGPANAALQTPSMQATNTIVYIFSGKWKEVGTNNIYNMDDNTFDFVPDRDMRLEPIYNEVPRTYPVKFFDHNGALVKTVEYSYLQIMADNNATPMYLGRSDEDLEWFERWTFKGWISEKDFVNKVESPTFINLDEQKISHELSLYPFYNKEDARNVETDLSYFIFREVPISLSKIDYPNPEGSEITNLPSEPIGTHYVIDLNPKYYNTLAGKITLPSYYKNKPITVLGKLFEKQDDEHPSSQITHIFFKTNAQYVAIGNVDFTGPFSNTSSEALKMVYFPENMTTLKVIGPYAFAFMTNLEEMRNLPDSVEYMGLQAFNICPKLKLDKLPTALNYIGEYCFSGCSSLTVSLLPHGLKFLPRFAFNGCDLVTISHFGNSTGGAIAAVDNNITHIDTNAFSMTSFSNLGAIYLHKSVTYIGNGAFQSYGKSDGLTIYDGTGLIHDMNIDYIFGPRTGVTIETEINCN